MLRILLSASLLLTLGAFYFAFVRKSRVSRWGFAGAFAVLLVLSGVLAYAAWQDSRPRVALSAYIDPFPGLDAVWVPPARRDAGEGWIQRTVGTPEDVARFYGDSVHLRGWTVSRQGAMDVYLRKGVSCLHIAMTPIVGEEGRLTILYTYRETCI